MMNETEFRSLSAANAIHALDAGEQEVFRVALQAHPEWQRIVDADLEAAAVLAESVGDVAPPPALRGSILAAIADTPQRRVEEPAGRAAELGLPDNIHVSERPAQETAGPSRSVDAGRARRRRAGWFALAAGLAIVLALGLTPAVRGLFVSQDPVTVALQEIEGAPDAASASADVQRGGKATLHWSDATKQAVLVADNLPGVESAKDYEAWIVRGDKPISLGVVKPGDTGRVALVAHGFVPGDALAFTVEDRGGSPKGVPTTDPLFVLASS